MTRAQRWMSGGGLIALLLLVSPQFGSAREQAAASPGTSPVTITLVRWPFT